MDTLEAIRKRRSIRRYTGDAVLREDLETIVDAGRLAATGSNKQPWDFIVVTDRAMIKNFKTAGPWMENAGAVICDHYGPSLTLVGGRWRSCHREYAVSMHSPGLWGMLGGRRCLAA